MKIITIFIDGIGIGKSNEKINPFYKYKSSVLPLYDSFKGSLYKNGMLKKLDACLKIKGIPQSATGQTAIMSGVNASGILGKHLFGFPNQKLRKILFQKNLLLEFKKLDKKVCFFNCYNEHAEIFNNKSIDFDRKTGQFKFDKKNKILNKIGKRISVTTVCGMSINQKFFNTKDLLAGKTVYQDFTNNLLVQQGLKVPIFSPEKAGKIIGRQSQNYDFVLYEYFLTDRMGHNGNFIDALYEIEKLDNFITAILDTIDLDNTMLCIISDHGNLEDMSISSHTKNEVPLLIWFNRPITCKIKSIVAFKNWAKKLANY